MGYACSWGGAFHALNLGRIWWDTPDAVKTWIDSLKIAAAAEGQAVPEERIAVFVDEKSGFHCSMNRKYFSLHRNYSALPQSALWRAGIRFDFYILEDALNPDLPPPKILLFADAGTLTVEDARKIRKKFGNSNRVIVWCGAPGRFAPGDADNVSKITDFKVKESQ